MFNKDGGGEQTVKNVPWSGVQPYLKDVFGQAQNLSNQQMEYYPGQTYADLDPLQMQGMFQGLQFANGPGQSYINSALQSQQSMMNAADVQNNPHVQGMIDISNRSIADDFMQRINPAIEGGAVAAGQYGGSRQGIAQGLAAEGAAQAAGDASTRILNDAYGRGLEAQARGLALSPQTMQLGFLPGQTAERVGSVLQGQEQRGIDEAMARHNFSQNEGWDRLSRYNQLLNGGLGFSTQTSSMPGGSPVAGALGGAMTGAALPSMLGPEGLSLMTANPAVAPFMIGGALLGGLFS